MKKILGAAVAASLLTAGFAHADIDNGASTYVGNGELFLAAWDDVAKRSVIVDLGVDYDAIVGAASATGGAYTTPAASYNLNIASALTAAFGSNLSNVRWNIGGQGLQQSDANFEPYGYNYGVLITAANPVSYNPDNSTINLFGAAVSEFLANTGNYINADEVVFGGDPAVYAAKRDADNFYVALNDQTPLYAGLATWSENSRYAPFTTANLGSGDLDLYWYHATTQGASEPVRTQLGSWTLDLATGGLNYANGSAPEVPVPAAAWLLVSGLAGLGTVARRRKQA